MIVHEQITAARAQALVLLVDSVAVVQPSRETPAATSRYGVPRAAYTARVGSPFAALVQSADVYAGSSSEPDRDVSLTEYVVKLPVGTVVEPGDKIIPASCVMYPQLVGVPLLVLRCGASSIAVLQRVVCQRTAPVKARS